MKNLCLILFLYSFFANINIANSQSHQYLKHYSGEGSRGPTGLISLSDGSMLVSGSASDAGAFPDYWSSWIFKTNAAGDVVDSLSIAQDSVDVLSSGLFLYGAMKDTVVLTALCRKHVAADQRMDSLFVYLFDTDLNLISRMAYTIDPGRDYRIGKVKLYDGSLVFANLSTTDEVSFQLSLGIVDLPSRTMRINLFDEDSVDFLSDVVFRRNDSLLCVSYVSSQKLFDSLISYSGQKLFFACFDWDLNFVHHLDTSLTIFNGVSVSEPINSGSWFLHGIALGLDSVPLTLYQNHPRVYKFNASDEIVRCTDIAYNLDTISYTGVNTLAVSEGGVYSFGFFNCHPTSMPYQNSRSWILLSKLDTNLHVEKIRFIGDDYFYMNYVAVNTADGGVALAGTWYDYILGEHKTNVFLLKTDAALSIGIEDQLKAGSFLSIYPNPVADRLNISLPENCTGGLVLVFDINGAIVQSENIDLSSGEINVSALASGTYYVCVFNKSGRSWAAEMVKL